MGFTTTLELRKTRRYVGTYQHEDEWETVCPVKRLATKTFPPRRDDYDVGPTYVFRLVLPFRPTRAQNRQVLQAIHDSFSRFGCHHEYDCCGCASFSANGERVGTREYRVVMHTSYNY